MVRNAGGQGLVLAAYKLRKLESLVKKEMEQWLNYGLIWAYKDSTVRIYKIECRGLDSKSTLLRIYTSAAMMVIIQIFTILQPQFLNPKPQTLHAPSPATRNPQQPYLQKVSPRNTRRKS